MTAAKLRIVAVAHHQPLRQRVADLPDPDLQRAAVADQARGMKPDGIFGVADRFRRRREQRKVGLADCRAPRRIHPPANRPAPA